MSTVTYAFTLEGVPLSLAGTTALDLVPVAIDDDATSLRALVVASLFTDARAGADDVLPDASGDPAYRGGWWGDSYASDGAGAVAGDRSGSLLWTLRRSRLTAEVVERAKTYAERALAWLVEDEIAEAVEVTAERVPRAVGLPYLALSVTITQGAATRHRDLWDVELAA